MYVKYLLFCLYPISELTGTTISSPFPNHSLLITLLNHPFHPLPINSLCHSDHWQDGIGPKHLRPSRPELAWLGTETNEFGTDEFLKYLEVLSEGGGKVEPYFCLNFGTGTLDEALAWVEYCNGTKNTYWANLRRKNGREEPWGIRYWALGNEVRAPHPNYERLSLMDNSITG